jgi:hypothetical protein
VFASDVEKVAVPAPGHSGFTRAIVWRDQSFGKHSGKLASTHPSRTSSQ